MSRFIVALQNIQLTTHWEKKEQKTIRCLDEQGETLRRTRLDWGARPPLARLLQ